MKIFVRARGAGRAPERDPPRPSVRLPRHRGAARRRDAAADRLRPRRRALRRGRPRRPSSARSTRSSRATRWSPRRRTTGSPTSSRAARGRSTGPGWYTHHHAELRRPEGRGSCSRARTSRTAGRGSSTARSSRGCARALLRPACRDVDVRNFGPAIPIVRVRDLDHALAIANGTRYGLSAGVVTNDLDAAFRCIRELRCGTVNVREVRAGLPHRVSSLRWRGRRASASPSTSASSLSPSARSPSSETSPGPRPSARRRREPCSPSIAPRFWRPSRGSAGARRPPKRSSARVSGSGGRWRNPGSTRRGAAGQMRPAPRRGAVLVGATPPTGRGERVLREYGLQSSRRGHRRVSVWLRGRAETLGQLSDPAADVLAHAAHLVERGACRVADAPVEMPDPLGDRTIRRRGPRSRSPSRPAASRSSPPRASPGSRRSPRSPSTGSSRRPDER